jgi:fucose 4-O-acetylase-like acetyltransferase
MIQGAVDMKPPTVFQPSAPPLAAGASRIIWLDAARGTGMLAVVVGREVPAHFRELFAGIYVFHMPLFFFLSGLLVTRRLGKSRKGFLIDLAITIVYPYFLWSIVQYSAIYAAGALVNRPVEVFWPVILRLPLVSISQFWFLYVLFLLHLAAWVVVPRWGERVLLALALMAKIAVLLVPMPVMLRLAMVHGLFYAAGVCTGSGGIERIRAALVERRWALPMLIVVGIASCWIAASAIAASQPDFQSLRSWQTSVIAWRIWYLPAALAGMGAVLALAFLASGPAGRLLAFIGKQSMAILVLHILAIAGTRIVLTRLFGPLDPHLLLVACVTAGIIGPIAARELARRFTASRALGLG